MLSRRERNHPHGRGKFAAMEKRKKDLEGDEAPKPEEAKSKPDETPSKSMTKDSKGRLVKIIDDDEEELDCEFLNNRQLFLNLCQGNHYQFDSLRRAKHTSMMVCGICIIETPPSLYSNALSVPVRFYKERDITVLHVPTLTSAMSASATPTYHATHIPCKLFQWGLHRAL